MDRMARGVPIPTAGRRCGGRNGERRRSGLCLTGRWGLGAAVAALLALVSACAGPVGPTGLPWAQTQGIRVGVAGWWNSAALREPGLPRALESALAHARRDSCGSTAPSGAHTARLLLPGGRISAQLAWSDATLWWRGCAYALPPTARWMLAGVAATARRDWSGQLLTWPAVAAALPVGSRASVTDWTTGLTFSVVRWGGRLHADVEPARAADAVTLRAIYGGRWSWGRRPVVVTLPNGTRVAASMNGMPHGGDSVPGNAFPGHFCLHFLATEVHRSRRIDRAHLFAILTAAGLGPGGYGPGGGPGGGPAAATAGATP